MKKYNTTLICLAVCFFWIAPTSSEMNGGAYSIYADDFSFTDIVTTSGDTFSITDTGGEFAATTTSVGTVELRGGFQAAERGILSFSVNPSSFYIGPITTADVKTSTVTLTVSTDSETGYTVAMSEDGDLRSGSNVIHDVADGSVTAGQDEYGVHTSGTDGLLSSDTGISGSLQVSSAIGTVTARQTDVIFSASAGSNTAAGTYSHIVTFTVTVNP